MLAVRGELGACAAIVTSRCLLLLPGQHVCVRRLQPDMTLLAGQTGAGRVGALSNPSDGGPPVGPGGRPPEDRLRCLFPEVLELLTFRGKPANGAFCISPFIYSLKLSYES